MEKLCFSWVTSLIKEKVKTTGFATLVASILSWCASNLWSLKEDITQTPVSQEISSTVESVKDILDTSVIWSQKLSLNQSIIQQAEPIFKQSEPVLWEFTTKSISKLPSTP